ncbi:MAG TPA: divalent metal cation transporter [Tepidisphaeraceae bacterium]|nr:divalent metal cation transporter [Tepidisphaeraceae bacterium]
MKKWFELALGIVTSMGGFLEVGSMATAAQAGAGFGYQLLWPILLGTICLIFLMEMAGRMAAICRHPLPAAVRERFGFNYFVIPLTAQSVVDYLVLTSEVGGMSLGLQLLTGISFQWWAVPSAILVWLLLWKGNFSWIEYGVSFLGLITVVFVVAAVKMRPEWAAGARGLAPSLPHHDKAHYWFLAVSILGATISPFLFNFYSSGAVEDEWDEKDLGMNRATAGLGMGFGGLISMAVLVAAATVLHAKGIEVEKFEQVALVVSTPLGMWGYWIVGAGIFIACLGAALELSLDTAYTYSQCFGWSWGENKSAGDATRFSSVYSLVIFLSPILLVIGVDPMKLTMFSMALTVVILPFIVLPFLVLMNDPQHVGEHRNGWIGNSVVFVVIIMAAVLAVVAIPLEIFGGK